mmetsp:Transcript_5191/g.16554  ORF Transcript_5191/g.16554 Transcript_5191/m.16554 type:complete len:250 (+) Transcript_5191:3069-3818(+)
MFRKEGVLVLVFFPSWEVSAPAPATAPVPAPTPAPAHPLCPRSPRSRGTRTVVSSLPGVMKCPNSTTLAPSFVSTCRTVSLSPARPPSPEWLLLTPQRITCLACATGSPAPCRRSLDSPRSPRSASRMRMLAVDFFHSSFGTALFGVPPSASAPASLVVVWPPPSNLVLPALRTAARKEFISRRVFRAPPLLLFSATCAASPPETPRFSCFSVSRPRHRSSASERSGCFSPTAESESTTASKSNGALFL